MRLYFGHHWAPDWDMQAVLLKNRKGASRAKPWMVDMSAKLSESGRRERHFFMTKKQADGFIGVQNVRLKNTGTDSSLLSPAEREASMQALKLLGAENPLKLVDIVREWKEREKKRLASAKMCDVWDRFEATKQGHSKHYLNQIKSTRNRFKEHEDALVTDLTESDVEKALEGRSKSAFNGYLRVIRAVLNFAVKKRWAQTNVTTLIDSQAIEDSEVSVLTNRQSARLLASCRRHFVDDLPYLLFGLFAGVRPDELKHMTWEMVHLEDRNIVLPPHVTKTGKRRVVAMEPTLCSWLRWFAKRPNAGSLEGPIVSTSNLRTRLRALRTKAKFKKWPQDILRHTYASNHLAARENLDGLLLNLGHSSTKMLWKHYHQAVTKKNAKQFWSLHPAGRKARGAEGTQSRPAKKAASRRWPQMVGGKQAQARTVKARSSRRS